MYTSQGTETSWFWPLCYWTETLPDMRDFYKMGWTLVSMLWIQAKNKTTESEIQGKIEIKEGRAD
jgi:hypothetical protein